MMLALQLSIVKRRGPGSGRDHGGVPLAPDADDLAVREPPAIRGAAQPVVVATPAKELVTVSQADWLAPGWMVPS
jgi:hypothetical protein